jgi:hypothetical protein
LDEIESELRTQTSIPEVEIFDKTSNERSSFFADTVVPAKETTHVEAAYIMDIEPENVVKTTKDWKVNPEELLNGESWQDDASEYKTFMAEVVSDEDIESVFGEARTVQNLSEEELEAVEAEEEPNLAVTALLRVLDVAFFVLEKSVTVILPAVVRYSFNAKIRYEEIQRNGQGHVGWEFLRRSANAKGRY